MNSEEDVNSEVAAGRSGRSGVAIVGDIGIVEAAEYWNLEFRRLDNTISRRRARYTARTTRLRQKGTTVRYRTDRMRVAPDNRLLAQSGRAEYGRSAEATLAVASESSTMNTHTDSWEKAAQPLRRNPPSG